MKGYEMFEQEFNILNDYQKEKILSNIFNLDFVSLTSVSLRKGVLDKLLIRMFDNNTFYQYIFIFGVHSDKPFLLHDGMRFVYYVIFCDCYTSLKDEFDLEKYPYASFVKMLLIDDYDSFCHLFHSL